MRTPMKEVITPERVLTTPIVAGTLTPQRQHVALAGNRLDAIFETDLLESSTEYAPARNLPHAWHAYA